MISSTWTTHELTIVRVLTLCVSVACEEHFLSLVPEDELQPSLLRLVVAGLVQRFEVNLHPRLEPTRPVHVWRVGERIPSQADLIPISNELRARWTEPAVPTIVYVASRKSANLFGSTASRLPDLEHRDHDLLLADVFAHYARTRPEVVNQWIGEHALGKAGFGRKDPDAFLEVSGRRVRIIESGGRYSAKQVHSLVRYAFEHGLDLELW